jgi:hypothetical protein
MSDPTAPGDGEDAVGDLLSTAAAPAAPDGRPGGVAGRASALRSAEAPRGKMGTPGSNKPMITTVAPWALPSRTGQAMGTRRRRAPPSFAAPATTATTDGKDTRGRTNTTSPSDERANVVHEVKRVPATYATETIETIESETVERPRGTTNEDTPTVPVPLPPRAFLDECPGLSDRDSRLDVRFMTYGELFATAKTNKTRIVVPTFQRTYCWTDTMARTFFRDVALRRGATAARVKGGHGTGKCLFRRVPARDDDDDDDETKKSLLCLDGQQRCTTAALSLAAIRDAAVVLLAKEKDDTDADAFRRVTVLEETARKADSALFLERDDARKKTSIFFPSRADRAAFAACVGAASDEGGSFLREKERTGKEPRKKNFLVAAKRALDLEALKLSPFALADALEAALKDASLTYVEIFGPDERVDLAQAFQWLQEKTLFAASAVLWNATPGLKFAACDLARNYLMASTLRLPVEAQEETYLTQWLLPLESRVVEKRNREEDEAFSEDPETKTGRTSHPSEAFDAFLKAFLDDDDARFAAREPSAPSRRVQRRTRRMCAMERDLRRMLLSEHAPESTKRSAGLDTAVWTYARFRSFAERVSMGREDEIEDDKSATDDSPAEFRVDFTTSAPPPSWEGPAPADAAPADEPRERVRSPEERGGPPGDPPSARDAEPPPVPVDDAVRREVLRRLVAFGEKAGFLA